jgi:type I restriction enzyme S subunit
MKYQTYPNYKPSGVEWLGDVPEHWEIKRLGQFFEERREKVSDKIYAALSVTMKGIVPQLENAAKSDDGDNRKLVLKDDFVINSRSDRKGSSGVSPYDGSVSLISIVLKPKRIQPAFVHHLFRSYPFQEEFYRYGKGIVADLWSTNSSEMKNILIPEMPENEQQKIANFLDHETAKIDTLIDKQQRLIALLKEKRQAVISHAVTKGLNPNAPMKPSGVEWLGDVPKHWFVVPIKRICEVKDGTHETPQYVDKSELSFPLVTSKDFEGNFICFENAKYISKEDHLEIIKRSNTETGDILMSMIGGNIGKALIVGEDNNFSIKNVALFKTKQNDFLARYILFYLQSGLLDIQISLLSRGGAQGFLSLGDIRNLIFFKISTAEIYEIVTYLNEHTIKFDELIGRANFAIELMQERRTALISAAVTGKIDVRDWGD